MISRKPKVPDVRSLVRETSRTDLVICSYATDSGGHALATRLTAATQERRRQKQHGKTTRLNARAPVAPPPLHTPARAAGGGGSAAPCAAAPELRVPGSSRRASGASHVERCTTDGGAPAGDGGGDGGSRGGESSLAHVCREHAKCNSYTTNPGLQCQ